MAHLTPDEFDLLLEQALPAVRVAHLDTCAACALEARETLALARAMATLPELAPRAGLADRVLAAMARPVAALAPTPVRHATPPQPRRRAWALAAGLAGLSLLSTSLAGAWLLANQATATAALGTVLTALLGALGAAQETIAAQLSAVPWAETLTLLATEPLRLAGFALLAITAYATLLFAFWNIMRPPRRGYAPSA